MQLINVILWVMAVVLAIPSTVFFLECIAAWLPVRRRISDAVGPVRFTVLMPAHDEEAGIERAVRGVQEQLGEYGRLIVLADNCTDRTAEVARAAGAEVIERQDTQRHGKSYALHFGTQYLRTDPPQVVVIVDADCEMEEGALIRLSRAAQGAQRPVQAVYLMGLPPKPSPRDTVSALAFLVKNQVRPRGVAALGGPCLLTGTGMAWPWEAGLRVRLDNGTIAEDVTLGLDFALVGYPPLLIQDVTVTSVLPQNQRAAVTQRTRWAHGYLQAQGSLGLRLLFQSLRQHRVELGLLALDLCIPPLSMLVLLLLLGMAAAMAAFAQGASWIPLAVVAGALGEVGLAVALSWLRFARRYLSLTGLLAVPFYLIWKIPIYLRFLFRPEKKWIRTERDGAVSNPVQGKPD